MPISSPMPNKCSAPNCKSNYYPDDPYIPVFELPNQPEELRQLWFNALHRENITALKHVYIFAKMILTVLIKFLIQTDLLLKFQEENRNSGRALFHPLYQAVLLSIRNHLQNPLVCLLIQKMYISKRPSC